MSGKQYSEPDAWPTLAIARRCRVVAGSAAHFAAAADRFTQLCCSDQRTEAIETVASELLPLCSAVERIGRRGASILRTRKCGISGRPAWLWGVRSEVRRDPRGDVLILGTWNYPLLLMGVQAAQALAAGNRVLLKPAPGCEEITAAMVECFRLAGVPSRSLVQLDASRQAASKAIDAGVDLIVLTGAAATGRKVLGQAAASLTPTIMELSGCDAVVVVPEADLEQVTKAISFGLMFNSGATCIGPRRLIVTEDQAERLMRLLRQQLAAVRPVTIHPAARESVKLALSQALAQGARDTLGHFDGEILEDSGEIRPVLLDHVLPHHEIASADVFAPVLSVIRVRRVEEAVAIVNRCRYRLAASVFGPSRSAQSIAAQLQVGSVAINDLLVPTADPRLPFGGRGDSGFGVTRGDEGLLAMSVPRVISHRRGGWMPHLARRRSSDADALIGVLQLQHSGSLWQRWQGLRRMVRAVKTARRQ